MQVVDGIDRELVNRSELSRTQISLQEANARNAELVGELDYLRRVGLCLPLSHTQWAPLLLSSLTVTSCIWSTNVF